MNPQGRIVGEGPETRISSRPSSRIIAESTTSTVALPRRRRRRRRWDCLQLGAKRSQVDRPVLTPAHGMWTHLGGPAIRRDQRGDSLRHQHRRPPGVRKLRALLTTDKHGKSDRRQHHGGHVRPRWQYGRELLAYALLHTNHVRGPSIEPSRRGLPRLSPLPASSAGYRHTPSDRSGYARCARAFPTKIARMTNHAERGRRLIRSVHLKC